MSDDYYGFGDDGSMYGGGYTSMDEAAPSSGPFTMPPGYNTGYSQRLGGGSFTGLNPWESEDWKPSFGPSDLSTPNYDPRNRMNPLGNRQLAPTSPSKAPPNLGSPERTLYNRYSGLLQDPSSMGNDPAYKFLFNQGMQALNRTAAANRMRFAGKTMNDATQFGQGLAYDYMNKMLPQYRAGSEEELSRWMGPSQLYNQNYGLDQANVRLAQTGTGLNNQERGTIESSQAAQDLIPMFSDAYNKMAMPSWGGGGYSGGYGGGYGGGYSPPSFGGLTYDRRLGDTYG